MTSKFVSNKNSWVFTRFPTTSQTSTKSLNLIHASDKKLVTMSTPLLFCHNPNCNRYGFQYESQRSMSLHLNRNPSCAAYLQSQTFTSHRQFEFKCKPADEYNNPTIQSNRINPHLVDVTPRDRHANDKDVDDDDDVAAMENESTSDDSACHKNESLRTAFETVNFDRFIYLDDDDGYESGNESKDEDVANKPDEGFEFCVSKEQKHIIMLAKLLDNINAPDYAMHDILQWASNAYADGFNFHPKAYSRQHNLNWIYGLVHNSKMLLPTVINTKIKNDLSVDIITFDFVSQLLSLLQNKHTFQRDPQS